MIEKQPDFFKTENGKIWISETFYSIQGEGKTIGTPSIFLRTQGCVLNCVWCDTKSVWTQGKQYTYEELFKLWNDLDIIEKLLKNTNTIHIILTGGEPLARESELIGFFRYLYNIADDNGEKILPYLSFLGLLEVETSGTILPSKKFSITFPNIRYNVSPKLRNSGMTMQRRNRIDPMNYFSTISWNIGGFMNEGFKGIKRSTDGKDSYEFVKGYQHATSSFKFVVKDRNDVEEALETYIEPYEINPSSVYLMSEAITRKQLQEREPEVVELAKEFGLNYSTRLHLHIWDKATGV